MKTKKLNLNKFRIAKLNKSETILGGGTTKTEMTTNTDSPTDPKCINTSKEFITHP